MLGIRLAFGGLLTTLIITTFSFSQVVSFEFKNVDTSAKTLDIYMTNQSGCSYCSDDTYNNHGTASQNPDATNQKRLCENKTYSPDGIWTNNNTMTEAECLAIPSIDGNGGFWFDGNVKGIQLLLSGIKITNISGGLSAQYFQCTGCGTVLFNSSADCDGDGTTDLGCNNIIATSFGASIIPPNSDQQLLMSIVFEDFNASICFAGVGMEVSGSGDWVPPTISDVQGFDIVGDYGSCYCASGVADECGVCGGSGILNTAGDGECCATGAIDCENVCDGSAVADCAGACGGSAVADCAGACGGSAVADCAGACGGLGIVNTAGDGACCATGAIDCANICDGSAVADCAGACGGSAVADCTGVCGGSAVDSDGDGVCDEMAIQISSNLPAEFSILQNFPNPFNPVTSIIFDVAEMDNISLIVYDLTGNEIATLVSGTYAPGRYQVNWNAVNNTGDGISSGMYIYRFISSKKSITRKMLYLK